MKPEFGNIDQIRLLELEKQYEDKLPTEYIRCNCGCKNCEAELEKCPYCETARVNLFTDDVCQECKKEVIPYSDHQAIRRLRYELTQPK